MQILEEPRLIHETEDVHIIEAFLTSSRVNQAKWQDHYDNPNEWIGRDFVMIPEKIFDPAERQPGHTGDGSYEEQMQEVATHSHGKIISVSDKIPYNDGTDDWYRTARVKLNGSLSASALVEHGNKTWTPFAVSPQVWPVDVKIVDGIKHVYKHKPMGLFLVIKGAYGDEATVKKMCTGSKLKCGTALSAAIEQLNHNTNDAMLSEVINSYLSQVNNNKTMSQVLEQQPTQVAPIKVDTVTQPVQPVELKKDETITFTKQEYEAIEKEKQDRENLKNELAELKRERDEANLNQVFGSIEDENVRKEVFAKYQNKDTKLVKQAYEDIIKHVLPKQLEAKLNESKNVKDGSVKASVLKPEPKVDKDESLSASIETDDLPLSKCRSILGL